MKYCTKCGVQMPDDARFCVACGTQVPGSTVMDKAVLDSFYQFLKWERLSWKIFGIVWLILSIILAVCGLIIMVSAAMTGFSYRLDMGIIGFVYLLLGLLYLPIAIVNKVMVKKTFHCMEMLYIDPKSVLARCGSVGMIVLAAFFNNVALIFIIINFVRTKTNKEVIDRL